EGNPGCKDCYRQAALRPVRERQEIGVERHQQMSQAIRPRGETTMTDHQTRRDFLGSGVAVAVASAAGTNLSAADGKADLTLHNGRIATMDPRHAFVAAVAVKGGKLLAVGSDGEVLKRRGAITRVVDVGGRTIIPGLNDTHLHLIRGGL